MSLECHMKSVTPWQGIVAMVLFSSDGERKREEWNGEGEKRDWQAHCPTLAVTERSSAQGLMGKLPLWLMQPSLDAWRAGAFGLNCRPVSKDFLDQTSLWCKLEGIFRNVYTIKMTVLYNVQKSKDIRFITHTRDRVRAVKLYSLPVWNFLPP